MAPRSFLSALLLVLHHPFLSLTSAAAPPHCPIIDSCSSETRSGRVDPCCAPSSGGLFVFRQRFQADLADDDGSWGIDGMDVLDCATQQPIRADPSSPAYSHEQIASFSLRSKHALGEAGLTFGEEEWAQSEVGEGVEELWERAWGASGRYISTLAPSCFEPGSVTDGVPLYFAALHGLHDKLDISKLLGNADITPSVDTTYSLKEIVGALSIDGHHPLVTCDDRTISSISWPLTIEGTFQRGLFKPFTTLSRQSNCPSDGIEYPSSVVEPPEPTQRWDPIYRPQPRAITKSHDDSRIYNPYQQAEPAEVTGAKGHWGRENPMKLGFFKGKDQGREGKSDGNQVKFSRDEL